MKSLSQCCLQSMFAVAAFILSAPLCIIDANAQVGGGGRGRGGESGARQNTPRPQRSETKSATAPVTDPMAAVEREVPSLRIDLKLDRDQGVLFDSFQRAVRDAAEASRQRIRRLLSFKFDDGSTVSAASIITTIAEADIARADAMRAVGEKMDALYATFNADQRRLFDRRIMQSQREPRGNS